MLKGTIISEYKRCGKSSCRCSRGHLHGPYYYRRWRDHHSRQRRQYVPRDSVSDVEAVLRRARESSPKELLRELRRLARLHEGRARNANKWLDRELGMYWHGKTLRQRRTFPLEDRDRAIYRLARQQISKSVGWPITENDYVALQRLLRSERKRRNRLQRRWSATDGQTGDRAVTLQVDLNQLPSYRKHFSGTERAEESLRPHDDRRPTSDERE